MCHHLNSCARDSTFEVDIDTWHHLNSYAGDDTFEIDIDTWHSLNSYVGDDTFEIDIDTWHPLNNYVGDDTFEIDLISDITWRATLGMTLLKLIWFGLVLATVHLQNFAAWHDDTGEKFQVFRLFELATWNMITDTSWPDSLGGDTREGFKLFVCLNLPLEMIEDWAEGSLSGQTLGDWCSHV